MGAVLTENEVDLHAPSHALRYVGIALGALALGAAVFAFESYSDKRDAVTMQRFDNFRAIYAERCGVPAYSGPVNEMVEKAYVSSPAIQIAVDKQTAVLQSGGNCFDVADALKKVDLAVPKPGSGL